MYETKVTNIFDESEREREILFRNIKSAKKRLLYNITRIIVIYIMSICIMSNTTI